MQRQNYGFPWGIALGKIETKGVDFPLLMPTYDGGVTILSQKGVQDAAIYAAQVAYALASFLPLGTLQVYCFADTTPFQALKKRQRNWFLALEKETAAQTLQSLQDELSRRRHEVLDSQILTIDAFNRKMDGYVEPYGLLLIDLNRCDAFFTDRKAWLHFFEKAYEAGYFTIAWGTTEIFAQNGSLFAREVAGRFPTIGFTEEETVLPYRLFEKEGMPFVRSCRFEPCFDDAFSSTLVPYFKKFPGYDAYATEVAGQVYNLNVTEKINPFAFEPLAEWVKRYRIDTKDLPPVPGALYYREKITLSNYAIDAMPQIPFTLPYLREIDLSKNAFVTFPVFLQQLPALQRLKMSKNRIGEIPQWIGALRHLQMLDLGANALRGVPSTLSALTELRQLYLSHNQIAALPEVLRRLEKLEELYLSNNAFTQFPEWMGELTTLKKLNISGNPLIKLPDWIASLSDLEMLSFANNQLTYIPDFVQHLKKLRHLDISYNQITELPEFLRDLHELETLVIWGNPISRLPEWIGELRSLKHLTVRWTHIRALPESIGNLTQLRKLDIGHNRLETIPESIVKLENLEVLRLDKNRLSMLPAGIGTLRYLDKESIAQITAISKHLHEAETLWQMTVTQNSVEAYEHYLSKFPVGAYRQEALERLDRLIQEVQMSRNDTQAWEEAQRLDTEEAYRNYLFTFPQGAYRAACKARLTEKEQQADSFLKRLFAFS